MELGEKIRQARLEAGLTQRQLCDGKITRNMLSLIEHGAAKPSMETLQYLAQRLGRSVGWFLDADRLQTARQAWARGDARGTLEALPREDDPEVVLLAYLATLQLAQEALDGGQRPYAEQLLARCAQWSCPYITAPLRLQQLHLQQRAGQQVSLPLDAYLQSQAACEPDAERARCLLQAMAAPTATSALLLGRLLLEQGQPQRALEQLQPAQALPEALPLLEACYRQLGDYQKAYEYAVKRRGD